MNESAEIPSAWRRSRSVCQETDCSSSAAILGQKCVMCVHRHTLRLMYFVDDTIDLLRATLDVLMFVGDCIF